MKAVPSLDDELAQLSASERSAAEQLLELRATARALAQKLGLDEGDTYHQLQHLRRSPAERLRLGLTHGRLRPRIAD